MNPGRQALQLMAEVKIAASLPFLWLIFDHIYEKCNAVYAGALSTGLYTESVDKRIWHHCC